MFNIYPKAHLFGCSSIFTYIFPNSIQLFFFSKFIIGRQHCAVSSKSCNFLIVYSCLLIGKHYIVRTLSHGYYLVLLTVCSFKCFTLGLCNIYYYHMISVKKAETAILLARYSNQVVTAVRFTGAKLCQVYVSAHNQWE